MRKLLRSAALVEAWFDLLPPQQQPLVRAVHALVLGRQPTLVPSVKWGTLGYALDDVPLMELAPHRINLQLQVLQGAALQRQFPELEGQARSQRHVRLRYSRPLADAQLLTELVDAVVRQARLTPGGRRGPPRD
jgi:hypothetical protein